MIPLSQEQVSVVVVVKNGERYIGDALDSIVAQTRRADEIIVIDGHSSDGTADIARSYSQVRYVCQTDTGIAHAYNQAIEEASHEHIAFLSSDDQWHSDKLQIQLNHLAANRDALYSIAHFEYFQQVGVELPRAFDKSLLGRRLLGRIMETLLARREAFELIGLFNEALPVAEDVDWFARAKDMGHAPLIVDEVLLKKRVHENNASTDPEVNTPALLTALRASIQRQKASRLRKSMEGNEHES